MMGVLLQAPPPKMSEDKLQTFKTLDAGLETITADRHFPDEQLALTDWDPVKPLLDKEQSDEVHQSWSSPDWNVSGQGPKDVQTEFVSQWEDIFGWGGLLAQIAKIPKKLDEQFDNLYQGIPLLTR